LLADGVLRGMSMSASGSVLTVGAGYLMACGRIIGNDADLAVNVSATSGYARITLVIDLSGAATETTFSQVYLRTDLASEVSGFPALVQDDINDGVSTTYELALAVLALDSSGIVSVDSQIATAPLRIKMGTAVPTTAELDPGEIYLRY